MPIQVWNVVNAYFGCYIAILSNSDIRSSNSTVNKANESAIFLVTLKESCFYEVMVHAIWD